MDSWKGILILKIMRMARVLFWGKARLEHFVKDKEMSDEEEHGPVPFQSSTVTVHSHGHGRCICTVSDTPFNFPSLAMS